MRRISPHGGFQAFKSLTGHLKPPRGTTPASHASYHDVTATYGAVDVEAFRSLAWEPAVPVHMRDFHHLPAMENWVTDRDPEEGPVSFGGKLESFPRTVVSYELMTSSRDDKSSACSLNCLREFQAWLDSEPITEDSRLLCGLIGHLLESAQNGQSRFQQFDAPLSLVVQASRYNRSKYSPSHRVKQLYIAQSDIRSLPPPLGDDLPVPEIVGRAGKGDIYNSSIWLGLQPTYTPLHRDPNPNLFCQLVGYKIVRLLRPRAGLSVFQDVRRSLGAAGNSHFRGPEMMDGPERDGLHRAIWVDTNASREIWETMLSPGDALFIPQGWWHSVRSVGHEAEPNASANWWFR
ncbi:Clavaminate synthase-like protein [Ustulina deusta]|nr:Clavaminate synthase-like protein [Ustulina deusta]